MRVPIEWLHDYCEPHMDANTLAQRLALTGTEVERVEHHGVSEPDRFVVGRVLERQKHADADRLNVCMVDVGGSTPSQIVCGAPNVAAGQNVGVARPGAVMPDGRTLQRAKLRGVTSEGMIVSEAELGIGLEHDGIMVLDDALTPGTPLAGVVPIGTDVLVLEITPNRPDCLGIYGVAREVHAATGAPLKDPPWLDDPGSPGPLTGVEIARSVDPALNPRFTARIFEDVQDRPTPRWMKARLMAAGQRPISLAVDITNYVMLLTGQPMHAFDLDRVAGRRLDVRRATAGERITTLDGQERTLEPEMVVIADADGPTSIAGVMGGARSEVSAQTRTILSEVATWHGANIHRTALQLALRSEASARNEKPLAPEQTIWAQAVAARLFTELAGATLVPGTLDLGGPEAAGGEPVIRLRTGRLHRVLGTPVSAETAARLLGSIGFATTPAEDGLDVAVPDFRRADVTREADLIEEVARLDGLDTLPATLPSRRSAVGALTAQQRRRRRATDLLIAAGLDEVVGWSFASAETAERLRIAERPAVQLLNPMSSEQATLRTTLLGSLLEIAARNRARGAAAVRIFEAGAAYLPAEGSGSAAPGAGGQLPAEPRRIAALLTGPAIPPTWRHPAPADADFFAVKAVLGELLGGLGSGAWTLAPGQVEPFLHPGRSAAVHAAGGDRLGWIGEVHPIVAAAWDLGPAPVAAFELDLDAIPAAPAARYVDIVSFPEVREDIAVIVPSGTAAQTVLDTVGGAGRPLLARAEVFDVYRDPDRIGEGNVSLALRLSFRAPDRTLTDQEVAGQRRRIIGAIEDELGGRIREH